METNSLVNILIAIAFLLLVVVSGGVVYLSSLEWRERRRQDRENRNQRKKTKS